MASQKCIHFYAVLPVMLFLGCGCAQAADETEITLLRHDIDEIKAAQKDIQRNVQALKDLMTGKQPPLDNVYIDISGKPAIGSTDAPVAIIEFTDFQCPFCGAFARDTFARLMADYVKAGKLLYISRNFPLEQSHPLALKAAEAAMCAQDQGKFWEAHDRFFADQRKLAVADMADHAVALGVDSRVFLDCIDRGNHAAGIQTDRSDGEALGVRGTPTFFIGVPDPQNHRRVHALKRLAGNLPFREFEKAIDELLAQPKESSEIRP